MQAREVPGVPSYLNESRMRAPAIDDTPLYPFEKPSLRLPEHIVEAAARRAAAVLRVLRERNSPLDPVFLHETGCLLHERVRISECNVGLVRCRFRVHFVQQGSHPSALDLTPFSDGRSAPNV